MNAVVLSRDAELLRAAPRDRAHIGLGLAVAFHQQALGGVDFGDRIGDFEVEHDWRSACSRSECSLLLKISPAIGALALEYGARIMQAMGEHVNFRLRPGQQLAVEPDHAFHLVEGHRHGRSSVNVYLFLASS